jgi:hypothetical protein
MKVRLHPHAEERLIERGATREEVERTVTEGEFFPAKLGRVGFRRNFAFNAERRGRHYATKQIEAYAVFEDDSVLVLTVITKFF